MSEDNQNRPESPPPEQQHRTAVANQTSSAGSGHSLRFSYDAGRRNLRALYAYTAVSRLWFDGSLWLIYWQHKGLSLFEIGVIEAILHLVIVTIDIPVGVFADRFGWRLSLICSAVAGICYCGLSIVAGGFVGAAIAFAFRGLQSTLNQGSDMAIAYESARSAGREHQYQKIAGRIFAVALVSGAVAQVLGGVLATVSWTLVYLAFGAANLVSIVMCLWLREPTRIAANLAVASRASAGAAADGDYSVAVAVGNDDDVALLARAPGQANERISAFHIARSAWQFASRNPLFARWIAFSAILFGVVSTFGFYGQSLLLGDGWSLIGIGILAGIQSIFGTGLTLASSWLTEKLGLRRMLWGVSVIAVMGTSIFAFAPTVGAGVGYLTGRTAPDAVDPLVDQELNRLIPTGQRATLLSANSTAFSAFMIVVFPVVGWLASRSGLRFAAHWFDVVGCIGILGVTWWLSKRLAGKRERV